MKIISPFHDYYDSILKYETDDSHIVYKREPIDVDLKRLDKNNKTNLFNQILTNYHHHVYIHISWEFYEKGRWKFDYSANKKCKFETYRILIIFCGKIYKCLQFTKTLIDTIEHILITEKDYFYDFNELDSYLIKNKIKYDGSYSKTNLKNYFEVNPADNKTEFLIQNKITIAVLFENTLHINCKLSEYDFYKVFDTFTAFQELNMWLSGTLSYPPNIMVEISNESKIEKAGFDKKFSFRKQKSNK